MIAVDTAREVFRLENVMVAFRTNAIDGRSAKVALHAWWHRRAPVEHVALAVDRLTVARGERLGVIGRNGAGKSTLLRVLAGVIVPQHGSVAIDPSRRVVPLLELGVGFHPDLSGAENCRLAGTLFGVSASQMRRRVGAIAQFAGVEAFMDEPVKHYSSGMYARLAFALAFDVEPDVMIIDEVFGVGDEFFMEQCLARIRALVASGATTVFVSHNLDFLQTQCTRLIWLNEGRIVLDGSPSSVSDAYRRLQGAYEA